VISQSLSLYRRHFGTLVFTCAVALLPANVLAAGAVVFGLAALSTGGVAEPRTHSEQVQEKQRDLRESPPPTAEARDERARQIGREALEGNAGATFDALHFLRELIPVAYATAIAAAVLLAGLFLAHAALVPLVLELTQGRPAGPAQAWAAAGSRIGPLVVTGLLAALLVAVGSLFFIVPGLVLAAGFSLAPPIVVLEGAYGRAALENSWRRLRCHWGTALSLWALIAVFTVLASALAALAPPGPWRPVTAAVVRMVLYPLPLVGLALLYRKVTLNASLTQARESPLGH
jgi:hypothetical protein